MFSMTAVSFGFVFFLGFHGIYATVTDEEYALLPNIFELDSFDNCMLLGKVALYCTIEFHLSPIDSENISKSWKQIKELKQNPKNYRHDILRHGICIPLTCPNITRDVTNEPVFRDELRKCYNKKYKTSGLYGTITHMHCQTNEPLAYDINDKIVIIFILIYLLFVIYATFYEGLARSRYKSKEEYQHLTGSSYGKFISCFSLPKNFYRLKTVSNSQETVPLQCIQGIRFYNMSLVILTHHIMVALGGPVVNPKTVESFTDEFENIFLIAGAHAVQTFFLISSWLLTYHVFSAFENKKELSLGVLFWIFINRYIRLTPPLAVVVALHSTLLAHSSRGPFWDHLVGEDYRNCRKNGWTNLVYINNYVNRKEMCMQQSWYLATDTQLFLLALVILAVLKKFKDKTMMILSICLTIGIFLPGVLAFVNSYDILVRAYPEIMYKYFLDVEEWHVLYSASYSNVGACVIGIIFGYLYYTYRNVNLVTSKIYHVLYFVLTIGLSLGIIALAYPMYDRSYAHSNLQSAIYWSTGKNIFTFAIAIVIFGMTQNVGWFALWVCRWSPLQVLGRLTYSAYLIHVFLLRMRASYIRNPLYISKYLFFIGSIGDIAVTYIFAFFFCLCFEMPVTALQKQWLPQKKSDENRTKTLLVSSKIPLKKEDRV